MMAFKFFSPVQQISPNESLGQSWRDQSVENQIALCPHQTIEPYFRKYLPKDGCILEAGCGLGRWVFFLLNLGYDIRGIEFSQTAVDFVKNYDPHAPIEKGDILNFSAPDNSLDAMISLGVVEHFEEGPLKALREAIRILKPGAILLITIPTQNLIRRIYVHPLISFKVAIKRLLGKSFFFAEYRFSIREFSSYLSQVDLEILEIVPDDFAPPLSIGLYVDFPIFRRRNRAWELNKLGIFVDTILRAFSVKLFSGGTLFVCKVSK